MQDISSIGASSGLTCPDCGGVLFAVEHGQPVRFLCHTGHAFSLRSLARTQEEKAEEALWSGLRALQEKAAILHRLADLKAVETPGSEMTVLAEAQEVAAYAKRLRAVVTSAPPSMDIFGAAKAPTADE